MSLSMSNGLVNKYVALTTEKLTVMFKNMVFVLGAIAILVIDIVTGPVFLGNFNISGNRLTAIIFWCVSLSLTATQMVFWDHVKKHGLDRGDPRSYLPAIGVAILMVVDTIFDVGFVTQLLYPSTPPSQILPSSIELVWYLLVVVIGFLSFFCEPLLMWFFNKLRNGE